MGWKPKSAEGIPGTRHQRRTWGASLKGSGGIFNMLGKYESRWSREVTALHLHFQKVILLHITDDWISSSVIPFSSCLQSFPASGSFPMSQLFTPCGQSIGVSVSASVLPINIQDWFSLEWTGWISLLSKGLSRVFSKTTVQKHQFFSAQLSL